MVAIPIPRKNLSGEPPANLRQSETAHDEGKGLTMTELVAKIGKPRQAIESARDKGTLGEFGYRAEKNGRNWLYWEMSS